MRVVKLGKFQSWTHTWTCKNCGSEIEANGPDIEMEQPVDKKYGPVPFVECPVCNERITFADEHDVKANPSAIPIPNYVYQGAVKRWRDRGGK